MINIYFYDFYEEYMHSRIYRERERERERERGGGLVGKQEIRDIRVCTRVFECDTFDERDEMEDAKWT